MRLWDGAGTAPLPLGCEQHLAATQALRGGRLQPEPWPLGSVPADASGQLSPFAPALPALFPSSSGYSRDVPRAGGIPLPHAQGPAWYSTDRLDPAPVGAGTPVPSPAAPWLSLQALPPFVFLVFAVFICWR